MKINFRVNEDNKKEKNSIFIINKNNILSNLFHYHFYFFLTKIL